MATTAAIAGSAAAAWMARKPPMLEPRRRDRGACCADEHVAHGQHVADRARARSVPLERPCPRASKARAARPRSRHTRPKSKWLSLRRPGAVQDHHAPRGLAPRARKSAYERPSRLAELGGCGRLVVLHNRGPYVRATPHRRAARQRPARRAGARVPDGLRPGPRRRAAHRRLRRARAGARVRHARLRVRRGRPARPRARHPRRVRLPHRPRSRSLYASQGVPVHRRAGGSSPQEGLSVRLRVGRRAAPGAERRLRPRADLHARQQQVRGRAGAGRWPPAWAT